MAAIKLLVRLYHWQHLETNIQIDCINDYFDSVTKNPFESLLVKKFLIHLNYKQIWSKDWMSIKLII